MTARQPNDPQIHEFRQIAESFGSDAERYDRARPSYPDVMVRRIIDASPGPAYLDVGTGTGIAARQFQAKGCQVLGVEVDPRMADLARHRQLAVEVAAFENWDPAGRVFDAVVSGQTWHWIDPEAGAAKAAEALDPGGRLSLFWNVFEPPSELAEAFATVYRSVLPDLPFNPWARSPMDAYSSILARAVSGMRETDAFDDAEEWRFDWERPYTREEWLDVVPTNGGHQHLRPAQLAELLAGLGSTIDAVGGTFTMGYRTVVITATRAQDH